MKTIIFMTSAVIAASTSFALAETPAEVAARLTQEGYTNVEIRRGFFRDKVEARGPEGEIEVTLSRKGEVLSSEVRSGDDREDRSDDHGSGRSDDRDDDHGDDSGDDHSDDSGDDSGDDHGDDSGDDSGDDHGDDSDDDHGDDGDSGDDHD